jgi:hypothetical protein
VKTQIIQLNQNDDTLSVQDKMTWCQTGRILLVWPVQGRVLSRQLDLNLVNRHAGSIGAQLGLVTHDSEVRFFARKIRIPVFSNLRLAQDRHWDISPQGNIGIQQKSHHHNLKSIRSKKYSPAPAWIEHPAIRFVCLLISVLALLILGAFILPSAKIRLTPRVEIQSMRFDLSADPSSPTINFSTGTLPTYTKEVVVEGSDTITATGSMIFPDDPAIGNLKFTNISKQFILIPAGTIVATKGSDPVHFITISKGDVTIYPNKSLVVAARAIKPGSLGNLPPNKLVVIPGELGPDLTVTNPDATKDGTDATVPTPTTMDRQILQARLQSQLKQAALIQIQNIVPDQDTLISPTMSMIGRLEETTIPSIGDPGNQLMLTLRLRFQTQVVSGEILRSLVIPILDSNTPIGYSPIINSLEITQLSKPASAQDGITHLTVSAMRKLQVDIQAYQVINIVNGTTVAKAREFLSASLPLMEQAKIILTPTWWPWIPFLTMRIQVSRAEIP